MRRTLIVMATATLLGACGGAEPAAEADDGAGAGAEAVEPADEGGDEGGAPVAAEEPAEPAEEGPGDGSRCLPVANCNSFANQTCARVTPDGEALGEDGEPIERARVLEACPGERGVDQSVQECFGYVDRGQSCRRAPAVRNAEWPCAWEGEACRVQSF